MHLQCCVNRALELLVGAENGWKAEVVHPEDRERYLRSWADAVRNFSPFEERVRLKIRDASYANFVCTAQPLRDADLSPADARFETFMITSDAFRNLGVGDCELVEEFARQILPRLATREVKRDITCVPFQRSGSRFLIRGEVLRAVPRP